MTQKIIKIGSSLGVTLSGDLLSRAGLQLGDTVHVAYDEREHSIRVESSQKDELTRNLMEAKSLIDKYEDEIQKLGTE